MKHLKFELLPDKEITVSQTFISLEGEGINVGEPSMYIRVSGCYSAACRFCDTKFSWFDKNYPKLIENGKLGSWFDIIKKEQEKTSRIINRITITGGEPLHFIIQLKELINHLNEFKKYNIDFKMLGIESNGNLLSSIDNLLELIQTFQTFKRAGINPHLTISPKIDSESCYEGQLSQAEINNMYYKVYENLENYFPFENYYKYVWNINSKANKLILDHIDRLFKLNVKPDHIFLMPYTPKDPLGKDKEIWEKSKDITAKAALKFGVRYSPRIHVDRKLD